MPDRLSRLLAWGRSRWRRDPDADMSEEIRLHLEQRIREFREQGLSPEQAKAAAYRQFGPVEPVKEACRDERRRAVWIGTVWQDLHYGARSLARDRAFTITAVLTLTLGVGLVSVFASVFNGFLLKPWPLPDPATLVTATRGVPAASYRHLRDHATSIDLVAITNCASVIGEDLKGSTVRCVSGNYFDVLRVPLMHGRGFRSDEDIAGAPVPVAVIGYELWRDRFSSSPDVIGRRLTLNQVSFQVVGVASRGATDMPRANLPRIWVPLAAYPLVTVTSNLEANRAFLFSPDRCCVVVAGRLKQSASPASVSAELTALHREFRGTANERAMMLTGTRRIHMPWDDSDVALVGLTLAGIVLVLVVACANTGNLQLARGSRRQQEFLVRLSLGAGRGRIIRQLLTEGLVLAGVASALSLVLAAAAIRLLTRWLADDDGAAFGIDLSLDWTVALISVSVASIAVLATALGPALRGTRRLVASGRSVAAPLRARAWFVVIQVGLSAVLIVGASLLGRGLLRASTLDPGYDADRVTRMVVRVPINQSRESRIAAIHAAARETLKLDGPPLIADAGGAGYGRVTLRDAAHTTVGSVAAQRVSTGFLDLLRVPVREGRLLREEDTANAVVINESFAKRAWPGRSALGAVFVPDNAAAGGGTFGARADLAGTPRVVVGVVGDMRSEYAKPGVAASPTFFERGGGTTVYVRNDVAVLERVRAAVRAVDPAASLEFPPLSAAVELGLKELRIGVAMAWTLGLVALAMAATGIFGVFAVVAEERRREVGIRLALGAGSRAVARMMLAHAGRGIVIGLAVGFLAALVAAPLLRSYLVGVGPYDPIAFAVAILVLTTAAATATFIPIRRALRIDPAITLRAE